jgi:hypothetical protein
MSHEAGVLDYRPKRTHRRHRRKWFTKTKVQVALFVMFCAVCIVCFVWGVTWIGAWKALAS